MKSCKRVEKYVKCQNDMGRSQNDMPDMRKLQASNTQTSDAACFFFCKTSFEKFDFSAKFDSFKTKIY